MKTSLNFSKDVARVGAGFRCAAQGPVDCFYEHGNELSGAVGGGKGLTNQASSNSLLESS